MNPWGESINDKDAYWLWDEKAHLKALRRCQCSGQKEYAHHERCLQCELDEIDEILEEDTEEFVENYPQYGGKQ